MLMSYIDNNLLTDEKIIYRTKKHLIIFLMPVILTCVTYLFFINSNPFVVNVTFLPGIAALVSWLNTLLIYYTSEFAVTNLRIMMKEGFFFRHSNETRLTTVAKVSITQSLLGQILNYGAVFINTFGGDADSFTELASPVRFQKEVQEQLAKLVKTPN